MYKIKYVILFLTKVNCFIDQFIMLDSLSRE